MRLRRDNGQREREREREAVKPRSGGSRERCFFDRVVRGGLLGVHHTHGIYTGIKGGRGRPPSSRRACAIFIARTTPACYSNPQPFGLSVNRLGPTIMCGNEPTPRLAPIRTNKRGFLIFFPLRGFFFFFSIIFRPREAPNQNLSVLYYREPFEGQSALSSAPRSCH